MVLSYPDEPERKAQMSIKTPMTLSNSMKALQNWLFIPLSNDSLVSWSLKPLYTLKNKKYFDKKCNAWLESKKTMVLHWWWDLLLGIAGITPFFQNLIRQTNKLGKKERKEKPNYLISYSGVEISREQIMVKIIKSEGTPSKLRNMMHLLQNLVHYLLGVSNGHATISLNFHQEPPQLLRRHVGAAIGVLEESFIDIGRRASLCDFELPSETHTHSITPSHDLGSPKRICVELSCVLLFRFKKYDQGHDRIYVSVELGVQELSNYATSWCLYFILFFDMLLWAWFIDRLGRLLFPLHY